MQEFLATSERRAELYWWFATLFSAELSDEQIAEYDSYDVRSFLKSLSTLDPMRPAVTELNEAIARLLVRPDRARALTADFKALFLADPAVQPYESAHLTVASLGRMQERLARLAIDVGAKYPQPVDHLGVELDLMGNLIIRAEAASADQRERWLGEQEALLHTHLLAWFPLFEAACRAADPFGFYGASARLLGVFLTMDANYLSLVKPARSAD
jgi:TorA specific chaperone